MISKQTYKALSGKTFINAQKRTSDDTYPYNIGKSAVINFLGKDWKDPKLEVAVIADNKEVFRYPAKETEIWFHEGWGGCDVVHKDPESGFKTTIVLHFTTAIKVSRW